MPSQVVLASALPTPTIPSKESNQAGAMDKDKEKELAKDKVPKLAKL